MSRKTYFRHPRDGAPKDMIRRRPRCPTCHKRIRGENHEDGKHHQDAKWSAR